jgi:hypothetical protein
MTTLNRLSTLSKQGATVRKRWTGLATSVVMIASALALQGTIAAQANHMAAGGSWTLYAAGDIADPDSGADELNAALIKAGIAADPDHTRVLMLGDGAYPDGSLDTYNREYGKADGWGPFKDKTYPVPGNHDYGTQMTSSNGGYRQYWQERLQEMEAAGGQTMSDQSGWYSFDLGSWHIIALNWACGNTTQISCKADGPQALWLDADLAKAKAGGKHILAMWHGARFFSQNDNGGAGLPAGPSTDSGQPPVGEAACRRRRHRARLAPPQLRAFRPHERRAACRRPRRRQAGPGRSQRHAAVRRRDGRRRPHEVHQPPARRGQPGPGRQLLRRAQARAARELLRVAVPLLRFAR